MSASDLIPARWSGRTLRYAGTWLSVVAVLGLVLVVGWLYAENIDKDVREKQRTDRLSIIETDGKRLATSLDAQRQQFNVCTDKPKGSPGCVTPVAPPAKDIAPTVVTGKQGPLGAQGLLGPPGARGPAGNAGKPGQAGAKGATGIPGPKGPTGADGSNGVTGEAGPSGPPGANGAPGADGRTGPEGQAAYPFTFTFVVGQDSFDCTLTAADIPATCATP